MKRRLISLVGMIVLIVMLLPTTMPVATAAPDILWPEVWDTPDCNCDVQGDESPAELDLVGCPAVYYHFGTEYAFFRERVNGDPSGPGKFAQKAWVVIFDLPAPGNYEYLLSLDGLHEEVRLYQNTTQEALVWNPILKDEADTLLGPTYSTADYARIVADGDGYFVDWAIPLSRLTDCGIDENTTMYFATSADANNYNKDYIVCLDCGECAELETQTIVSDTDTMVTAINNVPITPQNAVLAWEPDDDTDPSYWDTSIDHAFLSSADWIWESYRVQHPVAGDVVTFERTVTIPSDAFSITGVIHITCDNGYEVWLDGTTLIGSAQVHDVGSTEWQNSNLTENFVNTSGWQTVEAWNISGLHTGDNVFTFECANEYMGPADGQIYGTTDENPAGLIFEIYIAYCVPVECPGDGWYPVGDPYDCCDINGDACTCQDEEYRDYYCDDDTGECTYDVTDTRTTTSACEDCSDLNHWENDGATYTLCEGDGYCTYQHQVWWEYECVDGQCVGHATETTREYQVGCISCDDGDPCTYDYCEDGACHHTYICGTVSGSVPVTRCYLWVDVLGEIYRIEMKCCPNESIYYHKCFDPDGLQFLEIEEDMEIIFGDCAGACTDDPKDCTDCSMCLAFPKVIVMSLAEESPEPPDGTMALVYYDLTGYKDTLRTVECEIGTFFYPAITILLTFDPDTLAPGASNPRIACYDAELGVWNPLPYNPDQLAGSDYVTGETNVFASTFAILVDVPEVEPTPTPEPPATPEPAHFVISDLNITPAESKAGETVTISVNVANDGEQEGTYLVELKINGQTIDDTEVTLGAGQSKEVTFAVSATEPGQYEVVVSGLSGEFTVLGAINWWLWGSIIAAVILFIAWLIWYRRRRMGKEPAS